MPTLLCNLNKCTLVEYLGQTHVLNDRCPEYRARWHITTEFTSKNNLFFSGTSNLLVLIIIANRQLQNFNVQRNIARFITKDVIPFLTDTCVSYWCNTIDIHVRDISHMVNCYARLRETSDITIMHVIEHSWYFYYLIFEM